MTLSPPPILLNLLQEETKRFNIITVGSSAGGYAAILYGTLLNAKKIFAFNPQFEVNSLLTSSTENINPVLFRKKDDEECRKLYDIVPMIGAVPVYYFVSEHSSWDASQLQHLNNKAGVRIIRFKSSHHGVPFLRDALPTLFNYSDERLDQLDGQEFSPLMFSIKIIGWWKTITGTVHQGIKYLSKKIKNG